MAVLVERPLSDEIDGLRRAVGDPGLARIAPHVTLVPPVNVRAAELPAALAVLRAAAASVPGPITLTLGPVTSFMPANPVLHLGVGGDLERLRRLRDGVFRPPLERPLSWPWVPHVTLADGSEPDRIEAAVAALGSYAAVGRVDRVVLLEEGRGRRWAPLADANLGPPARVGTGGLPLTLTTGRLPDPLLDAERGGGPDGVQRSGPEGPDGAGTDGTAAPLGSAVPERPIGPDRPPAADLLAPVVVTAHREGAPVGTASARARLSGPEVEVWVRPAERGQGIGSHLLAHLELELRRAGWDFPVLRGAGPAGFYRARSRWVATDGGRPVS